MFPPVFHSLEEEKISVGFLLAFFWLSFGFLLTSFLLFFGFFLAFFVLSFCFLFSFYMLSFCFLLLSFCFLFLFAFFLLSSPDTLKKNSPPILPSRIQILLHTFSFRHLMYPYRFAFLLSLFTSPFDPIATCLRFLFVPLFFSSSTKWKRKRLLFNQPPCYIY